VLKHHYVLTAGAIILSACLTLLVGGVGLAVAIRIVAAGRHRLAAVWDVLVSSVR